MIKDGSLIERREALRRQLQAQRQLITQQLNGKPEVNNRYPRSMTMRYLTSQPALLTGEIATVLIFARLIKSIISIINPSGTVQPASTSK
jgi:hypothetical protein